MNTTLTAIIQREDDLYVALCPEFDVVSQGATVPEARENLREALELFFEEASPEEQERRCRHEVHVTDLNIAVGYAATIEAMKEAPRSELPRFASVEDLLDDLHADD